MATTMFWITIVGAIILLLIFTFIGHKLTEMQYYCAIHDMNKMDNEMAYNEQSYENDKNNDYYLRRFYPIPLWYGRPYYFWGYRRPYWGFPYRFW